MQEKVGKNAGLVWNALNEAGKALEAKELKKAIKGAKLTDKDLYAAFGWLMREGKLAVKEEGKEVFASLI